MTRLSAQGVPAARSSLARVYPALLAALVLLMLYMIFRSVPIVRLAVAPGATASTFATLLASSVIYLLGHFVRIARLALIVSDARISLRRLSQVHLFTAGVSLAFPFKLGDAYRAAELARIAGGAVRGITTVFLERLFDVAVILLLLFTFLIFGPPVASGYAPVLAASLLFVTATLLALTLVPDNLRRASSYIIRRYDEPWTVAALKGLGEARAVLRSTATMLNGRWGSLFALTALIWGAEAVSFALLLDKFNSDVQPLGGLLTFLSSITEGRTLFDSVPLAGARQGRDVVVAYLAATQVPLALLGAVAGCQLLEATLRNGRVYRRIRRARS